MQGKHSKREDTNCCQTLQVNKTGAGGGGRVQRKRKASSFTDMQLF